MRKVGIITLYKDSCNYGGLLQAYALTHVLNQMGYEAKQILPNKYQKDFLKRTKIQKLHEHGLLYGIELLKKRIERKIKKSEVDENDLIQTRELCRAFREETPHTELIDEDNLYELNTVFDTFIVGSDQVWNPKWMRDIYLLTFTPKKKLAYAASIARYDFSKYEMKQLGNALDSFDWISVRETDAVSFIKKNYNKEVDVVLDPSMLLLNETWKQMERKPIEADRYVLCYFLNGTINKRKIAQQLAEEYRCRVIYPIWVGETHIYNSRNETFLYNIGPRELLWLINHAEFVLTDSFHGTALSLVFEKQFLHILRDTKRTNMNSRIYSLLTKFHLEDRIIDGYGISLIKEIPYSSINEQLLKARHKSIELLKLHLEN